MIPGNFVKTPTLQGLHGGVAHKNEASLHRTVKEFTVNHKRVLQHIERECLDPTPMLSTSTKVAKRGAYMRDTMIITL